MKIRKILKIEKYLKAIEDQEKIQLNVIKSINKGSKLLKAIASFSRLGLDAKKLIDEIKEEQNVINFDKVLCMKTDGKTHFNFGIFEDPQKLASVIYYKGSLKDAKYDQYKMFTLLNDLKKYKPTNSDRIWRKKKH